jgi:hypothetical protein
LALTHAQAWAQAVGQAGDAANDTPAAPSNIGEIRMPADPSAAPVTRTISADFYGAADLDDWYSLTIVDEPSSTACFAYGHTRLEVRLTGFTTSPPPQVRVKVYRDHGVSPVNPLAGTEQNPYLVVTDDFGGESCGSTNDVYIHVARDASVPTPFAHTLSLKLGRVLYPPSSITAISPTSGPVGTAVTITGTALVAQVEFGGVNASITSSSPTSITTLVPAGAKTGPIMVYSTPSQQTFTVTTPPVTGSGGPRTANPSAVLAAGACCTVAPNPALAGRLGKLVVAFPSNAVPSGTPVAVLKDGKELQSGYGNQAWDLLPGNYDLSVSGKVVANVSVQSRSDTNVHVGVLRITVSSQTRWEVLDGATAIANGYGMKLVGLPVGSYSLRIAGQSESFKISDGQITDF